MKKERLIIKMNELKPGDIFSFRTIGSPIYWECVSIENELIYTGIHDKKYQFHSPVRIQNVLVKR